MNGGSGGSEVCLRSLMLPRIAGAPERRWRQWSLPHPSYIYVRRATRPPKTLNNQNLPTDPWVINVLSLIVTKVSRVHCLWSQLGYTAKLRHWKRCDILPSYGSRYYPIFHSLAALDLLSPSRSRLGSNHNCDRGSLYSSMVHGRLGGDAGVFCYD